MKPVLRLVVSNEPDTDLEFFELFSCPHDKKGEFEKLIRETDYKTKRRLVMHYRKLRNELEKKKEK